MENMLKVLFKERAENNRCRHLGVDMARAIAMFLVCWGHVVFLGEYVGHTSGGNHLTSHFINVLTVGCVDLFALISGFVGLNSKCKLTSYAKLWFLVFFYNIVIRIVLGQDLHDFRCLLPVYGNVYWYFTAYTGLFVIMPLINEGVKHLTRGQAVRVLLGIFSISFFTILTNRDIMSLHDGYSFIWLSLLYVVGAILRRFELSRNKTYAGLLVAVPLCMAFLIGLFSSKVHIVSYTSPFILAAMIGMLELFNKMHVDGFRLPQGGGEYICNLSYPCTPMCIQSWTQSFVSIIAANLCIGRPDCDFNRFDVPCVGDFCCLLDDRYASCGHTSPFNFKFKEVYS